MEKIKTISIVAFLVLIFSGCSLIPANNAKNRNDGDASFVLSQSVYKSMDGGKTWEVKNNGKGKANTQNIEILSFAINPVDDNNIYAGLRSGGILETKDGGEAWRFINYQSEKVYGLALSPTDGKTLYASGVWQRIGKMFKTESRGENWEEIYTSASGGPLIISLIADKRNSGVLYATSSDNQAFKSLDDGVSWKNIYNADSPILKISLDATNSNLIYFVTLSGSIFRSRDGGENFENISEKISQSLSRFGGNQFNVLEADPSVASQVYLAGSGGLIMSRDDGENWEKITILNDPKTFPVKALAISPKNSKEIVYGAAQAVYRSVDGGESWITSQFDNEMTVSILKYNQTNPDILYLGFTKK